MFWYLTILFGAMTILFLLGKGGFLIAGYNTASNEEKARYDERKLCHCAGGLSGLVTIEMLLLAFFNDTIENLSLIVAIITIVAGIITIFLMNTFCKKKNFSPTTDTTKKRTKVSIILTLVIVLFVIFACVITAFTGNITIKTDANTIKISSSFWPGETINYKDIHSISYEENFEYGSKTNGFDGGTLFLGHYKNDTLGKYLLYVYRKCDDVVLLNTDNGYVALNSKTTGETKALYERLKKYIQ